MLFIKFHQLFIQKNLPMYRNHYNKGEPILQTIDFSTLKKPNNQPTCRLQQNQLQLINLPNSPLLLLGIFAVMQQTIEATETQFSQFPFEAVPRQFQQFSHQKTACEILNIFRRQAKSLQAVVQLLNNYPIFVHIVQCWVRRRAMVWLQGNPSLDYMGNEHELLIDLSNEIRGYLLGLIATSLKIFVKIKFEIFPTAETQDCEEQLGEVGTKWELQVHFKPGSVTSGALFQKQGESTSISNIPSKASQCGFLRRSKMADNDVQVRSGVQFKSVKKQRGAFCQKCGIGRRCQCNQIKRKGLGGYGVTPKNNQLSTSTNGLKGQPFSIGFLNQHNISKIRQSNPGSR